MTIKKGPTDCWIWEGAEDEAPNKDAKMACDNPLCTNPRHVVKAVGDGKLDEDETVTLLKADLDRIGVKYRKNANKDTLIKLWEKHNPKD